MTKPKVFIGSSKENLVVARLLAKGLGTHAEVTVWDEGVFGLNKGFFETLSVAPAQYDYGVFVLAPDDLTTSKGHKKPSARDNVLFEGGLFMGALSRQRVFFVYDEAVAMKIPSDFAGVTLASYDGNRVKNGNGRAAVRTACRRISEEIKKVSFPFLMGRWKSRYPMTWRRTKDLCDEVVEITPHRDGVTITTIESPKEDYYKAQGRLLQDRQLVGEWWSREDSTNTRGVFLLNANPDCSFMYGYFTSPDPAGGVTYGSWTLAKICKDETETRRQLTEAEGMLTQTTVACRPKSHRRKVPK